jgi:hypothetical protein
VMAILIVLIITTRKQKEIRTDLSINRPRVRKSGKSLLSWSRKSDTAVILFFEIGSFSPYFRVFNQQLPQVSAKYYII